MSDMTERVAKAICVASGHPWEFAGSGYRETCIDFARAAIEAMRSPTVDMLVQCGTIEGWNEAASKGADYCHLAWWSSMIDSALSQDTHSLPLLNPPADSTSTGEA